MAASPGQIDCAMDAIGAESELTIRTKLFHRFYEPLALLHTLGNVRGEHTNKRLPRLELANLASVQDVRREFLNELAFACDYMKGGDSVTAIGLQKEPDKVVFCVAANKNAKTKIAPFLRNLLDMLLGSNENRGESLEEELFNYCVDFSRPRIKNYGKMLKSTLEPLRKSYIIEEGVIFEGIKLWLTQLNDLRNRDPWSLVKFAYNERSSPFCKRLSQLSYEPPYKTTADSLHNTCRAARHFIGRLGLHVRSAKALVMYARRLMDVLPLQSFEVRPLDPPQEGPPLRPPKETTLIAMCGRMVRSAHDPDLKILQEALEEMDRKFNLSSLLKKTYLESEARPRVHAELQILDFFETEELTFVGDDKYIACSKPACFCCRLYIRYHPGGYVEPESHEKIYLKWLPPGILGPEYNKKLQRILDKMLEDIRNGAIRQIKDREPRRGHQFDSNTGITPSLSRFFGFDDDLVVEGAEDSVKYPKDSASDDGNSRSGSSVTGTNRSLAIGSESSGEITDGSSDEEGGGVSLSGYMYGTPA